MECADGFFLYVCAGYMATCVCYRATCVWPSCNLFLNMISCKQRECWRTHKWIMERMDILKIGINIEPGVQDTEITIACNQLTPEIEKIIATLRILNQQLMVTKEDETFILDVVEIIYVEAVDRKTFVYTKTDVYESKLKLYEMEERLMECGFFRVSKSCLVQLRNIKSLKNDINRKLRLTMESGEQIMVSRQYADEIKRRLGVM